MDLDPAKSPFCDRVLNHPEDSARIPTCVDEGKSDEPLRMLGDDLGDLGVRLLIASMQRGHHDGLVDACSSSPAEVIRHRRAGIPRRGHLVAFAGVTMEVDDHPAHSAWSSSDRLPTLRERSVLAAAAMYQIEVSIPR